MRNAECGQCIAAQAGDLQLARKRTDLLDAYVSGGADDFVCEACNALKVLLRQQLLNTRNVILRIRAVEVQEIPDGRWRKRGYEMLKLLRLKDREIRRSMIGSRQRD